MAELLTAPRVMTGGRTVPDGAVVIAEHAVGWAGPAASLPAAYAELPRTDYPDSTIMPGLIDSHVHLGFAGCADARRDRRTAAHLDAAQRAGVARGRCDHRPRPRRPGLPKRGRPGRH